MIKDNFQMQKSLIDFFSEFKDLKELYFKFFKKNLENTYISTSYNPTFG